MFTVAVTLLSFTFKIKSGINLTEAGFWNNPNKKVRGRFQKMLLLRVL